ncbi:hypothetical protein HYZ82_02050 [Candidatus Nomurabacteria bacterium]|nr:hypothetical protein [Candidatus Nomurabacteria bacterium]
MKLKLLLLMVSLTIFGTIADAASPSSILVDISPSNPEPYEETTIVLNSYTYNLDSVMISWSVGGKSSSSGIGKKSFSTAAPAAGGETDVVATIALPDGVVETRITLRPSATVLLWQANDSYVPPFYRGKALPSADSEIKVVAMPEIRTSRSGGLVDPKNMTYLWKKDYTNDTGSSGYGKNFFTFVSDYLENSNTVSVIASTLDQRSKGEASINIRASQPKILFYKNDADLGTLWDRSLADHKINGREVLEAAPYFISPKEPLHPSLLWRWFINDTLVNLTSFRKNLMPLEVEKGQHGTSRLRLEIENRDKIFQTTNREINIEF